MNVSDGNISLRFKYFSTWFPGGGGFWQKIIEALVVWPFWTEHAIETGLWESVVFPHSQVNFYCHWRWDIQSTSEAICYPSFSVIMDQNKLFFHTSFCSCSFITAKESNYFIPYSNISSFVTEQSLLQQFLMICRRLSSDTCMVLCT